MPTNNGKFLQLRKEISSLVYERTDEINGLLLALLTREHVILVGPPGTAKSLVIRLVRHSIEKARLWEHLFTKFTMPEEVFGPVSIKALKDDTFRRVTTDTLVEAELGFGDEVFNANSSILNNLNGIINERIYKNDGRVLSVPLEVFMGATNTIPTDEVLAAFYDRFLLRFQVRYIAERGHFLGMLKGPKRFEEFAKAVTMRMTIDELHKAQEDVLGVRMPDPVLEGTAQIRELLSAQGIVPSDRRWNQTIKLVQAKAWLLGRDEASLDDLSVLVHTCWTDPANKSVIQGIVLNIANPLLKKAEELHDAFQDAFAKLQKVDPADGSKRTGAAIEALKKSNVGLKKLRDLRAEMEKNAQDTQRVDEFIVEGERILKRLQEEELGLTAKP